MAAVILVAACSGSNGTSQQERADPVADLVFEYIRNSPQGFIDQTLELSNIGGAALAPILQFEALDAAGEVLEDVEVSTAYGSDRGLVVVPAHRTALDFLQFKPEERIIDVADVAVTVVEVREVPDVGLRDLPEPRPISAEGIEVDKFGAFAFVDIQNPNSEPVTVRVVYLVYREAAPGESQQAEVVLPVAMPTEIAGNSSERIPVLPEFATRTIEPNAAVSLKAYISVPDAQNPADEK